MNHPYKLSVLALLVAIYFLFLHDLVLENPNSESMDMPMAIGYLQDPANPMWQNYKEVDPFAYSYPNKTFHPEWMLKCSPFIMACYYPFVKLFGVNSLCVSAYGTFYSLLALLLTFLMARKMFDKWTALLACFFLISSLSWLIHTRCGQMQIMPSVCLMIGVAYLIYEYEKYYWLKNCELLGTFIALAYLTGWIVFGFTLVMVALALLCLGRRQPIDVIGNVIRLTIMSFATVAVFVFLYSFSVGYSFMEINKAIWDGFTYRFNQGSVPAANDLGLFDRIVYCLKCVFWDMKAFDHPDKYLEGVPSINLTFTVMFLIGLWYSRKESTLMLWLVSVFGVFLLYLYSGRYGLLVLPDMAIIASHGILVLFKKLKYFTLPLLIGVIFIWIQTYHQYYNDFTLKRAPNFEVDRMRGHYEVYEWLKSNFATPNNLIVLGDPINTNAWQLMFHNFDKPYRFKYYPIDKEEATTVYLFGADTIKTQMKPDFTYSYNGKDLLYAFVIRK